MSPEGNDARLDLNNLAKKCKRLIQEIYEVEETLNVDSLIDDIERYGDSRKALRTFFKASDGAESRLTSLAKSCETLATDIEQMDL